MRTAFHILFIILITWNLTHFFNNIFDVPDCPWCKLRMNRLRGYYNDLSQYRCPSCSVVFHRGEVQ